MNECVKMTTLVNLDVIFVLKKFIDGEQNIDVTKVQISIKTRQYAKRQRTWARNQMIDWENIDHKKLNSFTKNIKKTNTLQEV